MNDTSKNIVKTIGFFGAYAYDIVLYLARNLKLMGKQVLVIDRSTEQEIICTIRSPSEADLQLGIFHFCGIDITARVSMPENLNPDEAYDVILYDFGRNFCPDEYHSCDVICYVLDMYVHNALRIQETEMPENGADLWMILRDLFRGKAIARYHMRLTGKKVADENVFSIRLNCDDFVSRFRMETDQMPRVELASEEMQEIINVLSSKICPEIKSKKKNKKKRSKRFSA